MTDRHYTIGLAGHIDHGKTALTKALTNVDTDRLKEEKERNISIELGFAPFRMEGASFDMSVIDVPGHERFIRQMIAGVAGIDLVIIVIAADEGIMPQTKEHMDILSLLHVTNAIVVLTKIDKAESELIELVEEDVKKHCEKTPYKHAPILKVDSLSRNGIDELKQKIVEKMEQIPNRNSNSPFRMPIDQVFSLKGVGSIVRGTIYEGAIHKEETVYVLPGGDEAKVRQIQVHGQEVEKAYAGQRGAINLAGIHKRDIARGQVVVKNPSYFSESMTIDVSLQLLEDNQYPIKQRSPIKLHIGSAEVYGKVIFFDRNKVQFDENEILCQIRLEKPIVVNREDRFILRRATPVETIGGGWVINPMGEKYKFGNETINMLTRQKEGTPTDQILRLIEKEWLPLEMIVKKLAMDEKQILHHLQMLQEQDKIVLQGKLYGSVNTVQTIYGQIVALLEDYHQQHSMRRGMNKPELLQSLPAPRKVAEMLVKEWIEDRKLKQQDQFISIQSFTPNYPSQWEKRMEKAVENLKSDGIQVKEWDEYVELEGIPGTLQEELKSFLLANNTIYPLSDKHVIHVDSFDHYTSLLAKNTSDSFSVKEAKDVWNISRKFLIPLLELLDEKGFTKRVEDKRVWVRVEV
ncbi:selenocysteine-specific elongation factor [Salirhabdus euzebyi]|uniref:Selenocysteine-specific elongation factor n=1 Tax=Salirhabdus euzebyi TaxID=394506 RepID=A0A841Q2G4_9BACI|nr:selenocysteine-specific translation elongation factor [Salirhabdus euzebyi]MBB6452812.1 selenocysteine-specific elongation factor [Salirhabdus euzebyi]